MLLTLPTIPILTNPNQFTIAPNQFITFPLGNPQFAGCKLPTKFPQATRQLLTMLQKQSCRPANQLLKTNSN